MSLKINDDYIKSLQTELQQLQKPDPYDNAKPSENQYDYTPAAWDRIQDLEQKIQSSTDYIDTLNSLQKQYQQEMDDAKAKLNAAGKPYCPPPSDGTSFNPPGSNGTDTPVARSTSSDLTNTVASRPFWFRSLTFPGASDQVFNGKPDCDSAAQPSKTDDKTSDQSKASSNGAKSDFGSPGETDKSDGRSTGNSDHANATSAGSNDRANTKPGGNNEYAMRSVAHERADMSQHATRANEAGHISCIHESGIHKGGMGGTHGGGFGRLGGMHGRGLGGLGGFGSLLLGGLGRL